MDFRSPNMTTCRSKRFPDLAENLLFFIFLSICVVAITWPWANGFCNAFANHWDPPLHAWKVWNMADSLLHGHIRPPGVNLNAYYPSSGSLYYESLYWPQGIVAAPVLAATGNPVLAFHVSYLFFWAFSGLCFRWLLLELGTSRLAASLGALLFTIIPYRTGYIAEFNMQLCFGIPLFLLFTLRWCRTQRPLDAAFAAAAICLQAASELYQAVFSCLCMPFVILALFRHRWREWLSSRRFWLSIAVAGGVILFFVLILFLPYLGQLDHSVSRRLSEVANHELEPFSYLASRRHMRWSLFPAFPVKQDEICVFPTSAIFIVAFSLLLARLAAHLSSPGTSRAERVLRVLRAAAFGLFLLATLARTIAEIPEVLAEAYAWLPVVIALLSIAIPVVSTYRDNTDRFMDGMCGAATFAYLMSLGPKLTVNDGLSPIDNPLFIGLYGASSILHGFRVVARFGIVVLFFLVIAASVEWDRFLQAAAKKGRRAAMIGLALIPFLSLVVMESVPNPNDIVPKRVGTPITLPFLANLTEKRDEPLVLATIPGWDRHFDAMNMFRIAGADSNKLLVMSWGGAYPRFSRLAMRNYGYLTSRPDKFLRQFASIWPECHLLVNWADLAISLPDDAERNAFRDTILKIADPVHDDGRYALMRFHRLPPNRIVEKWFRPDMKDAFPFASFRIVPDPPNGEAGATDEVSVSVSLNHVPIDNLSVADGGQDFTVRLPDIKPDYVLPFCLVFESNRPISVESFRLMREPSPFRSKTEFTP